MSYLVTHAQSWVRVSLESRQSSSSVEQELYIAKSNIFDTTELLGAGYLIESHSDDQNRPML